MYVNGILRTVRVVHSLDIIFVLHVRRTHTQLFCCKSEITSHSYILQKSMVLYTLGYSITAYFSFAAQRSPLQWLHSMNRFTLASDRHDLIFVIPVTAVSEDLSQYIIWSAFTSQLGQCISSRPARYTYWEAHNMAFVRSSSLWITVIEWERTVNEKCTRSARVSRTKCWYHYSAWSPYPLIFKFRICILECRLRPINVCNLEFCA